MKNTIKLGDKIKVILETLNGDKIEGEFMAIECDTETLLLKIIRPLNYTPDENEMS